MAYRKKSFFERLLKQFKRSQKSWRTGRPSPKKGIPARVYTIQEKLKILKEFETSGAPLAIFTKWVGLSPGTIERWQNDYQKEGEKGLRNRTHSIQDKLPEEIINKIIKLKLENPQIGVTKIVEWLAREDFVKVSRGAICSLLNRHPATKDLIEEKTLPKDPKKYEPKRFERSKPRQMYQMDITPWKLKGLYSVYVIACLDDYSRFIISWGIFRRQTSEHCIDVLRNAIEQYNSTPEEVLTDNGRQFYSWRGKNDFQKFLLKMGIKHVRSRPYHPQTLGKIESFWRNMYQELLSRETITSFEDMQEKMRNWIDRYNFKRPHQGIGSLVPADRFFGVEKQIREAMLEGAGMVKDALVVDPYRLSRPMYLIGRIGDKEIRVMAKDGSVIVKGVESIEKKSLPVEKSEVESPEEPKGKGEINEEQTCSEQSESISPGNTPGDQDSGSTGDLEQGQDSQGDLPGVDHQQTDLLSMGAEANIRDEGIINSQEAGTAPEGLDTAGENESRTPEDKQREPASEEGESSSATEERINGE